MTWEIVLQLIIKYGIDAAFRIFQITKEGPPDDAAWDKLKALSLKTYDDYLADAAKRLTPPA